METKIVNFYFMVIGAVIMIYSEKNWKSGLALLLFSGFLLISN